MPKSTINCKNCENSFDCNYKFCPHCGQKSNDKLTVGVLFSNTIRNYFSVDARFFKSFFPLLFKPGYLATKFVEGKRLIYLHPAQLYLFTSVLFFFFFSFKIRNQERAISNAMKNENRVEKTIDSIILVKDKDSIITNIFLGKMKKNQEIISLKNEELYRLDSVINKKSRNDSKVINFGFNEEKIDSLLAVNAPESLIYKEMGLNEDDGYITKKMYIQTLKLYKDNGSVANILKSFYDTIPIAMFILLPIFALILKLLFFNHGPFAYHLVFSFYYFSYLFSTFIILLLIGFIWGNFSGWLQFLIILSTFLYLCIAVKKFYCKNWSTSLLKSTLATLIYFLFVIPIAILLIGMFAFMYY